MIGLGDLPAEFFDYYFVLGRGMSKRCQKQTRDQKYRGGFGFPSDLQYGAWRTVENEIEKASRRCNDLVNPPPVGPFRALA